MDGYTAYWASKNRTALRAKYGIAHDPCCECCACCGCWMDKPDEASDFFLWVRRRCRLNTSG